MSDSRVAYRYAKSIFELATQKGELDRVNEDLHGFSQTCNESRELRQFLINPIIPPFTKLSIIRRLFQSTLSALTLSLFEIMVRKQRESVLPAMAQEFHNLYLKSKNIEEAVLVTAVSIDATAIARFTAVATKIAGRQVELKTIVDPAILGGYKLKLGDREIDETVKSQLLNLKTKLTDQTYIAKI